MRRAVHNSAGLTAARPGRPRRRAYRWEPRRTDPGRVRRAAAPATASRRRDSEIAEIARDPAAQLVLHHDVLAVRERAPDRRCRRSGARPAPRSRPRARRVRPRRAAPPGRRRPPPRRRRRQRTPDRVVRAGQVGAHPASERAPGQAAGREQQARATVAHPGDHQHPAHGEPRLAAPGGEQGHRVGAGGTVAVPGAHQGAVVEQAHLVGHRRVVRPGQALPRPGVQQRSSRRCRPPSRALRPRRAPPARSPPTGTSTTARSPTAPRRCPGRRDAP